MHRLHIRFGGLGFGFSGSPSPFFDTSNPFESGNGSASGGILPGSVVMAKKCDMTAKKATTTKQNEWNLPQNVSCMFGLYKKKYD